MSTPYLLQNVRPIAFPGHSGQAGRDIAVADGLIREVGDNLQAPEGAAVLDLAGAYLAPAWIDLHTHVYWGATDLSCRPQDIGLATGVPILVDAGSAGEANFPGLRDLIIKPARERVIPFLNVGSAGIVAANRVPDVRVMADIDVERILKTVGENAGLIAGLKVRLCSYIVKDTDLLPLKLAKKISRVLKLPLMVHIGLPLPLPEEVMDWMDPGDILTHCYNGKPISSLVADAWVIAAARRAKERGVVFDVGHGSGSFSYRVARECFERGLFPDTLGTDLYAWNMDGPVWDLSLVMSKMLGLGLSLEQVLVGVTATPRRVLGLGEARLEVGVEAAFSVFKIEDADLSLPDSVGERMGISRRVCPVGTFWRGEWGVAGSRLR